MEKKMENEMETLGPLKGVYRDNIPHIMKNQMEKNMENAMETQEHMALYRVYTDKVRSKRRKTRNPRSPLAQKLRFFFGLRQAQEIPKSISACPLCQTSDS